MSIRNHRDMSDTQIKVLRIMQFKTITARTEPQFIKHKSLNFI